MIKIQNYINGTFIDSLSNNTLDNINPATGEIINTFPNSNNKDIDLAVKSAKKAFPLWKSLTVKKRSEILKNIAYEIKENAEKLAVSESLDTGKPEWLSRKMDISRSIDNFIYFANAIKQYSSNFNSMDEIAFNYTLRQPIGVVGCISPWNLPLYLLTWKIAPALVTGNTVVAKPSELTPYTAFLLARICKKINLPDGVLNIVHGIGQNAGDPLVKHKDVKVITFTGGTRTGKIIAKKSASELKKVSLELGGKNPNIIFDDADIDLAVNTSIKSSFLNQGQICLCGSRILVQDSIYDDFKNKFLIKTKNMRTGDPKDKKSDLGSVISKAHLDKILTFIKKAKLDGGKVLCGGKQITYKNKFKNGFFIHPTIIEGLSMKSDVNQKEIFGPVVTLTSFKDEKELVKLANDSKYGLSASIFTKNIKRAHRVASLIEAGTIWINTWMLRDLSVPFGGMKESGIGREGGESSFNFFTEPKNVCVKL
tara:strand:+ start:69 stop:1511 length:1443 start_codon:yes stop_codon:yes gene_type:complete